MFKVGYLGPKGTFAFDAAVAYMQNTKCEFVEFPGINELIYGVDAGLVDIVLVPMENALEGTVNITVDMLIHEVNVKICGEVILPIRHYLLARPGVAIKDITSVLSHPQALAQCRKYLTNNLRNAELRSSASTAAAAKEVASADYNWAAIANKKASELYGLDVLSEDIQDNLTNSTRFVVLSKTDSPPTGNDKTSIAFTVSDSPGSLYKALKYFADKNINLSKIESRPMKTLLGQYLFLVDFDGHADDASIRDVLDMLSADCKFFVIIGSYPKHKDTMEV